MKRDKGIKLPGSNTMLFFIWDKNPMCMASLITKDVIQYKFENITECHKPPP